VILHPGVFALIVGAFFVSAMALYAAWVGVVILKGWDITSSSRRQLTLERKTYLVSTIMSYVMGFEMLSTFLFVFTADSIHGFFVGAMCATGTLNANDVGWTALYVKIVVFFLSALWVSINSVDAASRDYPLVRVKYVCLLFILPFILLDAYLVPNFFLGLRPTIVTSCCGSLFSSEGRSVAGALSAIEPRTAMLIFYTAAFVQPVLAAYSYKFGRPLMVYLTAIASAAFFLVSIASIISFISVYYYELPAHHCPFDMLQGAYHYIGYPLYAALFMSTLFGIAPAVIEIFKDRCEGVEVIQQRWLLYSMVSSVIFTIISSWPVVFSNFSLM